MAKARSSLTDKVPKLVFRGDKGSSKDSGAALFKESNVSYNGMGGHAEVLTEGAGRQRGSHSPC